MVVIAVVGHEIGLLKLSFTHTLMEVRIFNCDKLSLLYIHYIVYAEFRYEENILKKQI